MKNKRVRLNKEQIKDVIYQYVDNKLSIRKISQKTNINETAIWRALKRNNIDRRTIRKYSCNYDYFEKIDTEENAYWLGFLYADGCIQTRKHYDSLLCTLALSIKDKSHVEKFKNSINADYPLYYTRGRNSKIGKQLVVGGDQVKITISSLKLGEDLIKLGCIPNKSLILKFPTIEQVPEHLVRHFIRGYFDGDGCITYSLNKKCHIPNFRIDLMSTLDFCQKTYDIIYKSLGIKGYIHKEGKMYRIYFHGNINLRKIGQYLYKDATVFMQRKYDRFQYLNNSKPIKTSKYRCVWKNKKQGGWTAKRINYIGTYKTEIEAYIAVCDFELNNNLPFSNDTTEYYSFK